MVDLWLASVVNFESSDLRTRDRQQEELERGNLLLVDLDRTCVQTTGTCVRAKLHYQRANRDVHHRGCTNIERHSDWRIESAVCLSGECLQQVFLRLGGDDWLDTRA